MYSTVNSIFQFSFFDLDYSTSGLTVTGLARVYCVYFEQVLRNVRRELNREVSVLFLRSRLQAMSCSSLELEMFSSLWGVWLVFKCLEGCRATQREQKNNPLLHATPLPFEMSLQSDSDLQVAWCSVHSIACDPPPPVQCVRAVALT
jgi:hypothetical protein